SQGSGALGPQLATCNFNLGTHATGTKNISIFTRWDCTSKCRRLLFKCRISHDFFCMTTSLSTYPLHEFIF
ncbi:hypothetical protein WG66_017146, partial [Moniliophthora roreri]